MSLNGYVYLYMPNHHLAFDNGMVYEHKIVAESMLGRNLLNDEVVHHRDKNRSNNDISNLIVFSNQKHHALFHAYGCDESIIILTSNNNYEVKNYKDKKICHICGMKKFSTSTICLSCRKKELRKNIPKKEYLYKTLLKNRGNFTKVASIFGVTDNAVRKWCKSYEIPYKSNDYRDIPQ